jgi:hypothetical protein
LLKTYPLRHDKGEEIEELLRAYNRVLNAIIGEIWESIWWRRVGIKGEEAVKDSSNYKKDRMFKKQLRDK